MLASGLAGLTVKPNSYDEVNLLLIEIVRLVGTCKEPLNTVVMIQLISSLSIFNVENSADSGVVATYLALVAEICAKSTNTFDEKSFETIQNLLQLLQQKHCVTALAAAVQRLAPLSPSRCS